MGKTKRQEPRNGEFIKLRGSKKQRNKRQRSLKGSLQLEITFTNRNPNTGFKNYHEDIPNQETLDAMTEMENGDGKTFDTVEELMKDLNK